ncbi:hypothetical protein M514_19404 [Trichuris suis]|uniref:Uncharacterized protein n=1 Tax=Trichuris suis TaxID=68888 RepID=A0A085NFW2_9BILA|nr:hypothetical protein M514_19404 [Trichuris suis]
MKVIPVPSFPSIFYHLLVCQKRMSNKTGEEDGIHRSLISFPIICLIKPRVPTIPFMVEKKFLIII